MLSPDYLDHLTDDIIELYEQLNISITRDIARRIVKTGLITDSANYQALKLQEAGRLYADILKQIGQITGKGEAEIKRLFTNASVESLKFDDAIYKSAGLNPLPIKQSPAMLQMLLAGLSKTKRIINNLTLTTANASQTAYIGACDAAYMQVSSGAFDYVTAIRNAIKSAADSGAEILYPTGHSDKIDVAIRRSVLTGVAQTTGVLGVARAQDMDCDLMEITAHAGARPSHAKWQGKIVSLSGRKGYLSKADIGYGDGNGFKGWNCRHDWHPYFEGISTPAYDSDELKKLDEPAFEYEGKKYTTYEATQVQREFERRIRATKRELAGLDEAIKATDDEMLKAGLKEDFSAGSVKLKTQENKMREFLDASSMLEDKARTQVLGFGRSESQKAVYAAKKKR